MNPIPVIIDCDTGVDDALALLLALKLPELDVQAITSVAGNVEVEKTTANAIRVLDMAGSSLPVFPGAARPLFRNQVVAVHVHGENGLNNLRLPAPSRAPEREAACDAIHRIAKEHAGALELIAIGPLTNLALSFIKYRDLPELLHRIVIMGGAAVGGNVTPAAEFNIFADPEAADIVFRSGVPVHMCGLDVTMKGYLTPEELEELGQIGTPVAKFIHDVTQGILTYSLNLNLPGMCMHDPLTVLYAADSSAFQFEEAGVRVETKGRLTYGKTVTDLYSDKQFDTHNAVIVTNVDRKFMKKKIIDLLKRY